MESAFIDTGPLFEFGAAQNKKYYQKANRLLTSKDYRWYSSSYVFDELMTLLVQRVPKKIASEFGLKIRESALITWIHPSQEDEEGCWQMFMQYQDKNWSYTDFMSCYLIKSNQIKWVLSFDRDFSQMGFNLL